MTVPNERGYWLADYWSEDSAKEKQELRVDQLWSRLDDALPDATSLRGADAAEAEIVLLMVARKCLDKASQTCTGKKTQEVFGFKGYASGIAAMTNCHFDSALTEIACQQEKQEQQAKLMLALDRCGMQQQQLSFAMQEG